MEPEETSAQQRDSWAGVAAGAGLFLLVGLVMLAGEIPHNWVLPESLRRIASYLFIGLLAVAPIGFAVGWVRGFPRWSYPYTGLAIILSLYMSRVATPGLRIFGYTFGPNDFWGWRAYIPLFSAALAAALISKPHNQLPRLAGNIRQDWTILSFCLFGFLPLLIFIRFDEMDRLYSFLFIILLTAMMSATAAVYLRTAQAMQRAVSLVVGTVLIVFITDMAAILFWLKVDGVDVGMSIAFGVVTAMLISAPALLELLRQLNRRQTEGA